MLWFTRILRVLRWYGGKKQMERGKNKTSCWKEKIKEYEGAKREEEEGEEES